MKYQILFILHLPPPVHGASMMGKYIHDSGIINKVFECHYINLSTAKDLTDIGKISLKKIWKYVRLIRDIFIAVNTIKPQLVYITPNACGGAFYKDFLIVEMLKMMRCKIVAHYHNKGISTRQDKLLDNILYRKFFKGIKIILLSERLYSDVQKYVNTKNIFYCPNGIPPLTVDTLKGRSNRVVHLLFLSNLIIEKGVLVLLDALKIIKDKGLSFICDFVGDETNEINAARFCNEVSERGLSDVVVYHGRKYGEEKEIFLNQADVFVFPTYYHNECFPLVLLEAMQHGLPCVSTNEGAIADIIDDGHTGYIVAKNDSIMLSEKIEILIKNQDLRLKMGEAGIFKYKRYYTMDEYVKNIENILTAAVKG